MLPGSAADLATPAFRNGDKIVKIDDVPIDNYADINAQLAQKADRKIDVTVLRTEQDGPGKPTGTGAAAGDPGRSATPCDALGLVMKMGPITAIQADSPAAAAGLAPGDVIEKIDGSTDFDPMTLPDQLRRRAGKTVELTIRRKDAKTSEIVPACSCASRRASSPPTSFPLTSRWKRRPWALPTAS